MVDDQLHFAAEGGQRRRRRDAFGLDLLVLLHWNRHETTEPALELARKTGVPARTVHYAGFTSLQVALTEMLQRMAQSRAAKPAKA